MRLSSQALFPHLKGGSSTTLPFSDPSSLTCLLCEMGKAGTEQNALNCTQTLHHWVDRTLPHGDNSRAQKWTQVPEHLHGHYLILTSQPPSGWDRR